MKTHVKLFIANQVIQAQEQSLQNLLDTVPAKVLVYSNECQEDSQAQILYNNRQMKELFGQSFVTEASPSYLGIAPANVE